ncbi:GTP-binding protein [Streptomyces parvulus]|uniref:Cobalamin biosynthesis protein CobW n=1 Tax=Streptomyces parvulus TaxID=146923 RepID=A0A191V144_9ACTN|nr:GTP-binding protein [Streptomyces parvulus]ANJ08719.1 cobalamin biosynthesis protein CobW [Streptomyces parvulus]GGR55006.1 cobalamin biosynthesis protein CobW [Streptomyces parvulus]
MNGPERPGPPVVIVGGLHAEARRATVARLLADVPGSVVLHHDLATATAGTVVRTVRDATGVLSAGEAPLVNDCACCALREDLVPELVRLAEAGGTPLAVVELWDSVEPKAMAEVVTAGGFTVTGVITAVDPALVLPYLGNGDDLAEGGLAAAATDQRTVADTFARQLEYAPVLALAESLPGSPEADDEDRELLAQLHPTALKVPVGPGAATAAPAAPAAPAALAEPAAPAAPARPSALARAALAGFDVEAAAAAQHPACALLPAEADAHGVTTLVWHRRRPFHPGRLYAALEDLTCAAARSRGRFWLADKADTLLHWDAAGGALCVEGAGPWLASLPDAAWDLVPPVRRAAAALDWHPEHGDRCQHLVFTSPGLDRDGLARVLESCLLTDAEYAAGRAAWERLPSGFDTLLEV